MSSESSVDEPTTPAAMYRHERTKRGLTQREVADALGIHIVTQCRRELGHYPIAKGMLLAISSLPKRRKRQCKSTDK